MTHNQYSQHKEMQSINSEVYSHQSTGTDTTREAANMNQFNKLELVTSQPVDDILSRMDRLRVLASLQKKRSNYAKRQQFSFCF